MSLKIGVAVATLVVLVALGLWLVFRLTLLVYGEELRARLVQPGLALSTAIVRAGSSDDASLRRDLGDVEGFCIALYDREGVLFARSRDDQPDVPERLDAHVRGLADATPGHPRSIGAGRLDAPTAMIARVDGAGRAAYLGVFEHSAAATFTTVRMRSLSIMVVMLAFFALGVSAMLAHRIRHGIQSTQRVVHAIAQGALDRRLPAAGDDELGALVRDFNRMADRVEDLVATLRREEARKRALFAAFTHEINTPLTSVLGYLESLRMDEVDADPETRRRYVEVAYEQALALDALADDLETLSRLEHDGMSLDRAPHDLLAIARREIDALAPRAKDASVTLRAEGHGVIADVDRRRVGQVIRNLLDNAIRHSRAGGTVRVEVVRDPRGDASVVVRDEGEGIAAEHLARIGEPLFRVDPSRARGTGGRGLGLAIARGIAHAHGGTLELHSTLGAGTSARLSLPREPAPREARLDGGDRDLEPLGSGIDRLDA
ncbi:sensor histidine kinase [Sandaracinus amylolyticus]|uniref:sensor histidine kinase n=1 Tax=Sandaracinus amylolyticus TaxID=927083 RepID=UPI001F2286C7|nr:HAMP domain-containing sensor histidine kinase [Sandaracinus amylolyticus]UJR79947.1 Phosphate regulon sensor protein PhoR [Sandaracinus amylolyticus]